MSSHDEMSSHDDVSSRDGVPLHDDMTSHNDMTSYDDMSSHGHMSCRDDSSYTPRHCPHVKPPEVSRHPGVFLCPSCVLGTGEILAGRADPDTLVFLHPVSVADDM